MVEPLSSAYKVYALVLLSGLLCGIGFVVPGLWFVSFIGFVPFLYIVDSIKQNVRTATIAGFLFGVVYLNVTSFWLWDVFPLEWLELSGSLPESVVTLISWSALTFFPSIFFIIPIVALVKWTERGVFDVVLIPAVWVLFEYLRMWGFAIAAYEADSVFEAHFSVGAIGYMAVWHETVLQIADWGGIYILSFIVLVVNVVFYRAWKFRGESKCSTYAGVVVLCLLLISYVFPITNFWESKKLDSVSVAVVHTDFETPLFVDLEEAEMRHEVIESLMGEIGEDPSDPEIVILPESGAYIAFSTRLGTLEERTTELFRGEEKTIIDSDRANLKLGGIPGRVVFYNTKTQTQTWSDKQLLVPLAEYTPLVITSALDYFDIGDVAKQMTETDVVGKGEARRAGIHKDIAVGALLCSEIVSPLLYKQIVEEQNPDFLVNIASHGFFNGSKIVYNQTLAMAKMHAAQNDKWFVQATNFAPSFVIDEYGRIVAETKRSGNSVLYIDVFY